MPASAAAGNTKFVQDIGQGRFAVTDLPGVPAPVFVETAATAADLPAVADRPSGWPVYIQDTKSIVVSASDPNGTAAWLPPTSGGATDYAGARSFQPIAQDLTLDADAGKAIGVGTSFLAAMMGNLLGDALTKTGNYLAGLIGALSVTGAQAAVMGVAGIMGIIMDGVTEADAAVLAVLDGDSAQTNANAAFGVKGNNSTPGSGFNFGVDLQSLAHNGFAVLAYLKAALRLDNDVVVITGAGVPTDGTTGDNYAGPGSLYVDVTGANVYVQSSAISTPVWKLVTRAA